MSNECTVRDGRKIHSQWKIHSCIHSKLCKVLGVRYVKEGELDRCGPCPYKIPSLVNTKLQTVDKLFDRNKHYRLWEAVGGARYND